MRFGRSRGVFGSDRREANVALGREFRARIRACLFSEWPSGALSQAPLAIPYSVIWMRRQMSKFPSQLRSM
ncbi:hypothetical protein GCM10010403_05360 [Glycomyces rutgersensis]|uniref:Uncharacterized protein n=1 Tax=Glycomyces rutgersensis TaxID=58115 RepID=A0ABP5S3J5_9ACTN